MVGPFLLKGSRLTQAKRLPIINIILLGSSVAEQVTVNHLVVGSSPTAGANLNPIRDRVIFYPLYKADTASQLIILKKALI